MDVWFFGATHIDWFCYIKDPTLKCCFNHYDWNKLALGRALVWPRTSELAIGVMLTLRYLDIKEYFVLYQSFLELEDILTSFEICYFTNVHLIIVVNLTWALFHSLFFLFHQIYTLATAATCAIPTFRVRKVRPNNCKILLAFKLGQSLIRLINS